MLERMVLRAELVHDGRCIVGHTTEIGASSVFVRTDEPVAVGSEVQLRLSFPRLFAPLELADPAPSKIGPSLRVPGVAAGPEHAGSSAV